MIPTIVLKDVDFRITSTTLAARGPSRPALRLYPVTSTTGSAG